MNLNLDIHGIIKIKLINAPGNIKKFYREEYGYFIKHDINKIDVIVNFNKNINRDGFCIQDKKGKKLFVDYSQLESNKIELYAEKGIDLRYLHNYTIESLIQLIALKKKKIFLHASGVVYNGKANIFSGARLSGKSYFCLSLLNKGAEFLSDDLLIIDDKYAYCYPKRLNLFYYNFKYFPKIERKLGLRQRFFVFISTLLRIFADYKKRPLSVFTRFIVWLSNYKIKTEIAFDNKNIIAEKEKYNSIYIVQYDKKKENKMFEIGKDRIIDLLIGKIEDERKEFKRFYKRYRSVGKKVKIIEDSVKIEKRLLDKFLKEKRFMKIEFNEPRYINQIEF